ncbi:polyprenyl synthetase family protein [Virgifigura deserti]|uniref:polyprenyl synthetase family protein n=1 Tax=Virgifigura deserti TaxID=2268457 RepID=UPI003CCBF978
MSEAAAAVNTMLDRLLPAAIGPEHRLAEAMRYATMGGGKRIRPFLVLSSASLFEVAQESALRVAAAVEMLHCYSLVHDDLPAMDDSDLRRGRPTLHREFDEATAILAGDGLLTLAFEVLADPDTHGDAQVRAQLALSLARAAGANGMVGGQMLDLEAEDLELDIGAITRLQRLKTGEIIAFSCEAGAILGRASETARQALHAYAHDLGLAFQITDDLLDVEGSEATVGKSIGRDQAAGKATFVSILGVERARAQAELLAQQAVRHLDFFDEKADLLRGMAGFVVARRR